MQDLLQEQQTFEKLDYSEKKLNGREFIDCTFKHCNFANADLSRNEFTDCRFEDCNLSMAKFANAKLNNVRFQNCKLIGVSFTACNDFLFEVSFQNCALDLTDFFKKKLKKTTFQDCSIKEANFAEADLTEAKFLNCDLFQTTFDRTNLEKADFTAAYNYTIDPELNRIKKSKILVKWAGRSVGKIWYRYPVKKCFGNERRSKVKTHNFLLPMRRRVSLRRSKRRYHLLVRQFAKYYSFERRSYKLLLPGVFGESNRRKRNR